MKPRLMFRPTGHVIRTRSLSSWLWPLAGTAGFLGVLGAGTWLDQYDTAMQLQAETQRARSFEAGRAQGHAEMVASAEAAWKAAQAEADHCRRSRP